MTTKIAIAGAKGRMGENLIRSGLSNQNTQIVGVFDAVSYTHLTLPTKA